MHGDAALSPIVRLHPPPSPVSLIQLFHSLFWYATRIIGIPLRFGANQGRVWTYLSWKFKWKPRSFGAGNDEYEYGGHNGKTKLLSDSLRVEVHRGTVGWPCERAVVRAESVES